MPGVTATGFEGKDLATIVTELEDELKAQLGQGLDVEADSVMGNVIGVFGAKLAELWEVAGAVYASQYPDSASNQSLDNVAAITGTKREGETSSTVSIDCNIDGGFTLPAGSVAFDPARPDDTRFLLDADLTNPGGAPATFPAAFTAETPGPVVANAGTLTGGPDLVTGWNSATNPLDAVIGQDVESDQDLRLRRAEEVAGPGGSSVPAIRADVRKVDEVVSVDVLENTDSVTSPDGIPPHAFETIVLGGDDTAIANAILKNKPAGIRAYGSTVVVVQDDEGNDVEIGFTRPTERAIWLEYDLAVDETYPAGGDALVQAAVVAYAEATFGQGADVVASRLLRPAFEVLGVQDVVELRLGFAAAPVGTANLPILVREIATFDTSRVAVSTVPFVDV